MVSYSKEKRDLFYYNCKKFYFEKDFNCFKILFGILRIYLNIDRKDRLEKIKHFDHNEEEKGEQLNYQPKIFKSFRNFNENNHHK